MITFILLPIFFLTAVLFSAVAYASNSRQRCTTPTRTAPIRRQSRRR
jgi:hypothetical protein